jgi:hypothetical protein
MCLLDNRVMQPCVAHIEAVFSIGRLPEMKEKGSPLLFFFPQPLKFSSVPIFFTPFFVLQYLINYLFSVRKVSELMIK